MRETYKSSCSKRVCLSPETLSPAVLLSGLLSVSCKSKQQLLQAHGWGGQTCLSLSWLCLCASQVVCHLPWGAVAALSLIAPCWGHCQPRLLSVTCRHISSSFSHRVRGGGGKRSFRWKSEFMENTIPDTDLPCKGVQQGFLPRRSAQSTTTLLHGHAVVLRWTGGRGEGEDASHGILNWVSLGYKTPALLSLSYW